MNPILLLHGALGSLTQLGPLKNLLEQAGREVCSMNFSGHSGAPFREAFDIETFSDDVLQFLDRHRLNKVDIFGYSMGGYVAVWLAHTHAGRVGKIVTLGTKFDWSPESASMEVRKLNVEKILEKIPAFARILEHRHAPNDWKELLLKTSDMMLSLGNQPLITDRTLQSIQHEVVILLGDQDDMADREYSKRVADVLSKGTFRLLENTSHPIEKVELNKLAPYLVS